MEMELLMFVICFIALQVSPIHWENVTAEGKIIKERESTWYVDFTEFLKTHPEFKEWNYQVLSVNANDCSYKETK